MSPFVSGTPDFAGFSLRRRIGVLMLLATILTIGVVALRTIPVELMPSGFSNPFLQVWVPYSAAAPTEIVDKIARPLEEELATIGGVERISSWSESGGSSVSARFKQGTDLDVAYREVRDRVERARRLFPDDADRVVIRKFDADGIPIAFFGIALDPEIPRGYDLVQEGIVKRLQRIDGVANVGVDGLEEKEILIELDRDRTHAAGLNIFELSQRLGQDNFTMASGHVFDSSKKLLLRSVAEFESVEELEALPLAPGVRLGDIATIKYEEPEKEYRARAMSKPAFAAFVFKEGDANTREVSRRVIERFEEIQRDPRFGDSEMIVLLDQGQVIDEALATLGESGLIGGIVAFVVLFLFLRRLRMVLVVALSIPLSLLIGLTVMHFAGESLNLLSLLGLMICVGLLVDNAVIVSENIHRLRHEGLPRREATLRGTREIALAMTMSTLTTIIVFVPAALVEGELQFLMQRLAFPIALSLGASLVVALIFVPLAVFLTLDADRRAPGRLGLRAALWERVLEGVRFAYRISFGVLGRGYDRMLAFFLPRRLEAVFALGVAVALTMGIAAKEVQVVNVQEEEQQGIDINVQLPDDWSLEDAEEWFLRAERVIEESAEELDLGGWFLSHDRDNGDLQAWLNRPRQKPDLTAKEIAEVLMERIPVTAGVELTTGQQSETEDAAFSLLLYGEDEVLLEKTAQEVERLLVRVEGVIGAQRRGSGTPNELGLMVDRERTQAYGVSPQAVAGVVSYALRGASLPKYDDQGVQVPVRVRFQEEDRTGLDELRSFLVPTAGGDVLPLSAITDVRTLNARHGIYRVERQTARRIVLDLVEDGEEDTRDRLDALIGRLALPEGVSFERFGTAGASADDTAMLRFALTLSIVFVYLLMGFLFESFVLPLSILVTIPLAGLGAYWSHFLAGKDFDFLGIVGVVLLIGVVVNNGIVLVDTIRRLREEGLARRVAIRLAARQRFRPIMMTALTTIGGMVPLALAGANSIGLSYTSFALTLIGGMTSATLLTLLVVPVFYTLFDDLRVQSASGIRSLRNMFGSVRDGAEGAPS